MQQIVLQIAIQNHTTIKLNERQEGMLRKLAAYGPIRLANGHDILTCQDLNRRGLAYQNHMGWDILNAGQVYLKELGGE